MLNENLKILENHRSRKEITAKAACRMINESKMFKPTDNSSKQEYDSIVGGIYDENDSLNIVNIVKLSDYLLKNGVTDASDLVYNIRCHLLSKDSYCEPLNKIITDVINIANSDIVRESVAEEAVDLPAVISSATKELSAEIVEANGDNVVVTTEARFVESDKTASNNPKEEKKGDAKKTKDKNPSKDPSKASMDEVKKDIEETVGTAMEKGGANNQQNVATKIYNAPQQQPQQNSMINPIQNYVNNNLNNMNSQIVENSVQHVMGCNCGACNPQQYPMFGGQQYQQAQAPYIPQMQMNPNQFGGYYLSYEQPQVTHQQTVVNNVGERSNINEKFAYLKTRIKFLDMGREVTVGFIDGLIAMIQSDELKKMVTKYTKYDPEKFFVHEVPSTNDKYDFGFRMPANDNKTLWIGYSTKLAAEGKKATKFEVR